MYAFHLSPTVTVGRTQFDSQCVNLKRIVHYEATSMEVDYNGVLIWHLAQHVEYHRSLCIQNF